MFKFKKKIIGVFIFLMFFGSFYPSVSFAEESGPWEIGLFIASKFIVGYDAADYLFDQATWVVGATVDGAKREARWLEIEWRWEKGDRYLFFILDDKKLLGVASGNGEAFIYTDEQEEWDHRIPEWGIVGVLSEDIAGDLEKVLPYKVTGVASCVVNTKEIDSVYTGSLIKIHYGGDCNFGDVFNWNQQEDKFGSELKPKITKASEKTFPVNLEVDQGTGKWYTKFEVVERGGNVEDRFKKLNQTPVHWTSTKDSAVGGDDWAGKAVLEINVEGLPPGTYNVPIKAVQDFKEKTGVDYKKEETKTIYFVVLKEDIPLKKETSSGTVYVLPDASVLNNLQVENVQQLIGNIIKTAMGLMGSIALIMFVYGGFLWMTAMGNAEKSKKSTEILIWTSLGMIVILASWTVLDFVFSAFK